ncbi:MAG: DUF1800 domain-containing protein, partial [Comamonadaceae bacterium]
MTEAPMMESPVLDASPEAFPDRSSPPTRAWVGTALTSATFAACGGGSTSGAAVTPGPIVSTSASDEEAARFLLQAQFSASDADMASVRTLGYAVWLDRQLALPLGQTGWDWLDSRGYGDVLSRSNYYDSTYQADYMMWNQ